MDVQDDHHNYADRHGQQETVETDEECVHPEMLCDGLDSDGLGSDGRVEDFLLCDGVDSDGRGIGYCEVDAFGTFGATPGRAVAHHVEHHVGHRIVAVRTWYVVPYREVEI
jgi:hypothetical protein